MNAKRAAVALLLALTLSLGAEPLTPDEVSFFVRVGETDAFITEQLAQRKLVRALTPEQEAKLTAQGASATLLRALREPKLHLSDADAISFEKRYVVKTNVPQKLVQIAVPAINLPANFNDAGAATGVDLIIEKVVIQTPPPLPGAYYVWIQAKTGRAAVTFNVPGKSYGSEAAPETVEIPLNMTIKNVRLQDWAAVTIHFDKQDKAVGTDSALKKATARLEISKDPLEKSFIGKGDENDNFVYQLKWHAEER